MNDIILKVISLGAILIILKVMILTILDVFNIKYPMKDIVPKYRLEFLFLISLMGTVGSLLLSLYFKLAACELCWYQRIFLFTIPVISLIALLKNDVKAKAYVFWLSLIGFCFALYHTLLQSGLFSRDTVFCNPNSFIDCSVPSFVYFGFVTVPVISCAVFLVLLYVSYERKQG